MGLFNPFHGNAVDHLCSVQVKNKFQLEIS
jgi:hypothetical protein